MSKKKTSKKTAQKAVDSNDAAPESKSDGKKRRVRILKQHFYLGDQYQPGETGAFDREHADRLISIGAAEPA